MPTEPLSRRWALSAGLRLTVSLTVATIAAGLLPGCDGEQQQDGASDLESTPAGPDTLGQAQDQPARPRVALVMKTLTNPFFIEMERGARQAETDFDIQLLVRTAGQETSIEQQIVIVDELVRNGVEAIVIAPGDSQRLIPGLAAARQQGIVVVNIDNRLDPDFSRQFGLIDVPFISIDNEAAAYASARFIADQVTAPTDAAIIEGIRDAANAEARRQGALRAFRENANVTVVASDTANWKIDEGYTVAQRIFREHPMIGLLFCANDMMALGAIQFLQESGNDSVLVAAFDNLEEAQQAIRSGRLAVTVDQQAARQGYLGVDYAVRMLRGEAMPDETMINSLLVHAGTLGG